MKRFNSVCLALVCAWMPLGKASASDLSGAYFGASFGRSRNQINTDVIDAQLQSEAVAAGDAVSLVDRSSDRLSHVWWVDGGYFLTPYMALDLAFLHIGRVKYLTSGTVAFSGGDQALSTAQEITSHGVALSVIGRLPLTNWLEVDFRAGDYIGRTIAFSGLTVAGNSTVSRFSKTNSSLLAGAGVACALSEHWSLRADYLRINKTGSDDTGKFSVNMVTAGISFIF